MLFLEVGKALKQMSDKFAGVVFAEGGNKAPDFRNLISELEGMMQKEKEEFGILGLTKETRRLLPSSVLSVTVPHTLSLPD
ncbi:hypothetical protein K1719_020221 [Acacia pycnantha]|nr:hypothetical protein K1719_020221 [Acacia pycnantha]